MPFIHLTGAAVLVVLGWLLLRLASGNILRNGQLAPIGNTLFPRRPDWPYLVGALLGTLVAGSLLANHILFWYRVPLIKVLLLLTIFPLLSSILGAVFETLAKAVLKQTSAAKIVGLWAFAFIFAVALASTLTSWRAVLPPGITDPNYQLKFSRLLEADNGTETIELVEVKLSSALTGSQPMRLSDGACRGNASQGWLGQLASADAGERDLICHFQAQPGDYIEVLLHSNSGYQIVDVWINDVLYTHATLDDGLRFLPIGIRPSLYSTAATVMENATKLTIPGVLLFALLGLTVDRKWLPFPIVALAVFALACAIVLLRNAWVVEDQFITMRVIENLVHGYGPNFNAGYRVQAFTHPLWMLLLAAVYFITNQLFPAAAFSSLYYLTAFTSLLLTALTFVLLFRIGIKKDLALAFFAATLLLLSKSFVDYSVSGLENALLNVLLLSFLGQVYLDLQNERSLFWPFFVASSIVITRQDALLLLFPTLLCLIWKRIPKWRELSSAAFGLLPLIAWHTFSLVYFGFLVPNTAFAKLNTGIPRIELLEQGLAYFANAARWDLLAVLTIVLALILALYQRDRRYSLFALGVLMYLLYIVWIGGDFMSGRFLVAPLVMSVGLIAVDVPRQAIVLPILLAVCLLGLLNPRSPLYANTNYGQSTPNETRFDTAQIADERAVFFAQTGLLRNSPGQGVTQNLWLTWQTTQNSPVDILEMDSIGMSGYRLGPDYVLIDLYALADPLLSKLPADFAQGWRIGHFGRPTPAGYRLTLFGDGNHIEDANLAAYWDKLQVLVQGDIWSPERFVTIWRMNTGQYQYLLDAYKSAE